MWSTLHSAALCSLLDRIQHVSSPINQTQTFPFHPLLSCPAFDSTHSPTCQSLSHRKLLRWLSLRGTSTAFLPREEKGNMKCPKNSKSWHKGKVLKEIIQTYVRIVVENLFSTASIVHVWKEIILHAKWPEALLHAHCSPSFSRSIVEMWNEEKIKYKTRHFHGTRWWGVACRQRLAGHSRV